MMRYKYFCRRSPSNKRLKTIERRMGVENQPKKSHFTIASEASYVYNAISINITFGMNLQILWNDDDVSRVSLEIKGKYQQETGDMS